MAKSKKAASSATSDVSNKAIIVALVLVILVSVVSLGVYMRSLDEVDPGVDAQASGTVGFRVEQPTLARQADVESGKVSLAVVRPQ